MNTTETRRMLGEIWRRAELNTATVAERTGQTQDGLERRLTSLWYTLVELAEFDGRCLDAFVSAAMLDHRPDRARAACGVNIAEMASRLLVDRTGLYRRLDHAAALIDELAEAGQVRAIMAIGMEALMAGLVNAEMRRTGRRATA